jgi:hypothetical protein
MGDVSYMREFIPPNAAKFWTENFAAAYEAGEKGQ